MTQGLELRGAVLGKGYRLGRRLDDTDDNVYEATHERIPGHFILRLFPSETLSQPEASSRIQRGARVASLLRDPHVLQVVDCSASGEMPAFVVMERLPGRSLREIMAEEGMLALPRVVEVVDSIAAGLWAGHQIGLVHGDLRPAHIIIPTSGHPAAKLAGFGWAKELRAAARVPAQSGYLAPEQHFGKVLTLDARVDQFGLAALAYEMIAACLPFSEESADLAEKSGIPRIPPAVADLVPGVPTTLDAVLRKALSFVPNERFADVQQLAAELRIAAAAEVSPPMPTPTPALVKADLQGALAQARPGNEITEELDLSTLSPMLAEFERGAEASWREQDEQRRAKAVFGRISESSGLSDDAKTQIARSPFFEEEPAVIGPADDDDHTPKVTIEHGLPTGSPAGHSRIRERDSGAQAVVLAPPKPVRSSETASNPLQYRPQYRLQDELQNRLQDRLTALGAEAYDRRIWTFPSAAALALLLLAGTIFALTRGPSNSLPAADSTASTTGATADVQPPNPSEMGVATGRGIGPTDTIPVHQTTRTGSSVPTVQPIIARIEPQPPLSPASSPALDRSLPRSRGQAARSRRTQANAPQASLGLLAAGTADCAIRISSKPWAEVWIDGRNTGRKTPIDNLKVACGTRKLELKRPDLEIEQTEIVKVTAGTPYHGVYDLE